MAETPAPIVIRKVVKPSRHHGGSWKVAFADFATAMMAFFLLLWLIGATDAEQKGAISEYFQNPSRIAGNSDVPNTSPVQGPGGAMDSLIEFNAASVSTAQPDEQVPSNGLTEVVPDSQAVEQLAAERERERLEALKTELEAAFKNTLDLEQFDDQLLIDIVPEGLRIQVVDKENRPMFDLGSDELKPYTVRILAKIAETINTVPNRVSIRGHTDAHAYFSRRDYTNWELSSERSNAARRTMVANGLLSDKVKEVVGRGSSVPFLPDNRFAPVNRRISIIVLNAHAAEALDSPAFEPDQALPPVLPE